VRLQARDADVSGGSMNYLYGKVEEAEFKPSTPLRRAFREHLKLVAKALRAIEWNDSGDGDSTEDEAIRACLPDDARLGHAVLEAKAAVVELNRSLNEALLPVVKTDDSLSVRADCVSLEKPRKAKQK